MRASGLLRSCTLAILAAGCASAPPPAIPAGRLIVAGASVAVDVPVVTFLDPGGFDAHVEHRWLDPTQVLPSSPAAGCDTPLRYSRRASAAAVTAESVTEQVDQFVVHYDAAITSWNCFRVLHDVRGLSVHFLLDLDGTLYQTLDLAHRARHAGKANDRSLGIEIAHRGAYPSADQAGTGAAPTAELHPPSGGPFLPARDGHFRATINGSDVVQHDFTEAQYRTLERLVPELLRVFPRIRPTVPRGVDGEVQSAVLADDEFEAFAGLLAHWHVSGAKVDPGPAFDWERVVSACRKDAPVRAVRGRP